MNPQMIAKIKELGFEVTEKSGALIKVSLPQVPAKEKMLELFGTLGPEDEILFENFYPSGISKGKAYMTESRTLRTAAPVLNRAFTQQPLMI